MVCSIYASVCVAQVPQLIIIAWRCCSKSYLFKAAEPKCHAGSFGVHHSSDAAAHSTFSDFHPLQAQQAPTYGANRWDVAEFETEQERERFQKLMGVRSAAPTVPQVRPTDTALSFCIPYIAIICLLSIVALA